MSSIKYISILLVAVSFVISCGHKGDKNDPAYKKVMVIHDEVMPKLSYMHKLRKKLRKTEGATTNEVLTMITNLEKADEGMMEWMAQFDPPAEGQPRADYLKAQLTSVQTMANAINNSIKAAEQYLK